MAADKKNQNDIHSIPLFDLKSEARFAIVMMVFRYLTKDAMDAIDATVRSVRRRWDQLTPSTATVEERREWPPSLAKERSAWDLWFQKFMGGIGTVEQLDEMIQRVNAADRRGAPTAEKIRPVSDLLNSILGVSAIGAVSRVANKTNVSSDPVHEALGAEDVEIAAMEKELARRKADRDARKHNMSGRLPPIPTPPPFSSEPDTSLYDGMDPRG